MEKKIAKIENYNEICHELGFYPDCHFVEITRSGKIAYTVGKPDEIKALYQATIGHGYTPAKSLVTAFRRICGR